MLPVLLHAMWHTWNLTKKILSLGIVQTAGRLPQEQPDWRIGQWHVVCSLVKCSCSKWWSYCHVSMLAAEVPAGCTWVLCHKGSRHLGRHRHCHRFHRPFWHTVVHSNIFYPSACWQQRHAMLLNNPKYIKYHATLRPEQWAACPWQCQGDTAASHLASVEVQTLHSKQEQVWKTMQVNTQCA